MEAARLFREMRTLMREDAARRQQATRFGTSMPAGVGSGSGESSEPVSRHALESRVQAAKFVTGRDSHQQLEREGGVEERGGPLQLVVTGICLVERAEKAKRRIRFRR